ncbi:MAG: glycosyltransferase, exosortase A system-associated [Proteobacteria bacterium]|nr:MAG: glycosyltransferase, exosortase A system-associated [Pseudomonadota bacterium]
MKILHILDHSIPLHSGYTFRTRSILREQRKLGWETVHVTSEKHNQAAGKIEPKETVDGLTFYRTGTFLPALAKVPVLNQWLISKGLEKRILEVAALEKPDILHAHSPALNGLAAINAGRKLGIPVVYEVRAFWEDAAVDHGTTHEGSLRYRLTRALETFVLKKADAVTTICQGLKNDMESRGIPAGKITPIPNAVDIEKFEVITRKNEVLSEQLELDGKYVVGFIGSFYGYEGLPLIIDALAILKDEMPELHVLLVGGGPEDEKLKACVKQKGLDSRVTFTGRVPHDVVNDYYSVIDVLAYPRLSMRLTELVTPLKPLEAMAQKSLFIASNVGGHHELVDDGKTGLLFKQGDASALADKIRSLKENVSLHEQLKENGRQYVEQERNWTRSVSNYSKVYSRLVGINAMR